MRRTGASSKVKVLCECRRPPRYALLPSKRGCSNYQGSTVLPLRKRSPHNRKPLFRAVSATFIEFHTSHGCVALTQTLYLLRTLKQCLLLERGAILYLRNILIGVTFHLCVIWVEG